MSFGAREGASLEEQVHSSGFFDKGRQDDEEFGSRASELLQRRLSSINAGVLFEHAQHVARRRADGPPSPEQLAEAIVQAAPTFMPATERVALAGELHDLLSDFEQGRLAAPNERTVRVSKEGDLKIARRLLRDLCQRHQVSAFVAQKALAVCSELTRNIIRFAGSGQLRVSVNPVRGALEIRADDQGPGIVDLASVLPPDGEPRRRSGSGLFGVKRLADEFEIESDAKGTHVTVRFLSISQG